MKKFFKSIVGCLILTLIVVNVFIVHVESSEEVNLLSLKTGNAQTECDDDERDVTEACVKPCPGGGSAGGTLTFCLTGNTDCTPKNCDADCGIQI